MEGPGLEKYQDGTIDLARKRRNVRPTSFTDNNWKVELGEYSLNGKLLQNNLP